VLETGVAPFLENLSLPFPKGVNLHVETKTKFSWEIFGLRNELKKGGEEN